MDLKIEESSSFSSTFWVLYNFVLSVWWPWSTFEKYSRRFSAICVRHLHEWALKALFGATVGRKGAGLQPRRCRRSWNPSSTSSPLGSAIPAVEDCRKVPLMKMLHTDSGETSRIFLEFRPRSSNPENKIIHNTGFESLSQFNIFDYRILRLHIDISFPWFAYKSFPLGLIVGILSSGFLFKLS